MTWTDRPAAGLRAGLLALACAALPGLSAAQAPLSANDWIAGNAPPPDTTSGWRPTDGVPPDAARRRPPSRGTLAAPPGQPAAPAAGSRAPVAESAAPSPITVTRLGQANADAAGLQSARAAGLPADLWNGMTADEVAALIAETDPRLPAMQALFHRILSAQLAVPPHESLPEGGLLLARVDRLIAAGDLPGARALLQAAGTNDPQRFARSFDLDLLAGEELRSCADLAARPGLARDMATRIYCLALNGDWAAAALSLGGAEPLGLVDAPTAALLARFLDDGYAEIEDGLPDPASVTPLIFDLHEAVGQPLATGPLPLIYAWADITQNGGWKARLEAAERLARAGVLPPSQLASIHTEQKPAASGGVWDRAAALQALVAALESGDPAALDQGLLEALRQFSAAGLAPALADMIAGRLPERPAAGPAGDAAVTLRLLAGLPVTAAENAPESLRWTASLAAGAQAAPPGSDPQNRAARLGEALVAAESPADTPVGRALLGAIANVDAGLDGDMDRAARGLRTLRALGHADAARQAAVELMLLPDLPRGAP